MGHFRFQSKLAAAAAAAPLLAGCVRLARRAPYRLGAAVGRRAAAEPFGTRRLLWVASSVLAVDAQSGSAGRPVDEETPVPRQE